MRAPRLVGRLQGHAESLMQDACTITRVSEGALNGTTGVVTQSVLKVYAGRCRLVVRGGSAASAQRATPPGAIGDLSAAEVHVPVSALGIEPGDIVTVTASVDPDAVGRTFAVRVSPSRTLTTARRLIVDDAGV